MCLSSCPTNVKWFKTSPRARSGMESILAVTGQQRGRSLKARQDSAPQPLSSYLLSTLWDFFSWETPAQKVRFQQSKHLFPTRCLALLSFYYFRYLFCDLFLLKWIQKRKKLCVYLYLQRDFGDQDICFHGGRTKIAEPGHILDSQPSHLHQKMSIWHEKGKKEVKKTQILAQKPNRILHKPRLMFLSEIWGHILVEVFHSSVRISHLFSYRRRLCTVWWLLIEMASWNLTNLNICCLMMLLRSILSFPRQSNE